MNADPKWRCPICGGDRSRRRWRVDPGAAENGLDAHAFRPSADRYGETVGRVVACETCGHGSLAVRPSPEQLAAAYAEATDPDSDEEEPSRRATAERGLAWVETSACPGRLVDIGCWTGSLVAAAGRRGWVATGVDPSGWAVQRAQAAGLDVRQGDLDHLDLPTGEWDCVVMCDVLEHLLDPAAAVAVARQLLNPSGVLYVSVPDAGSHVARVLGAHWWSVLPMHVQYFTRASMHRLLTKSGFRVVGIRTHPKQFTTNYYAGRLAGYWPALSRAAQTAMTRLGIDQRLIAPDFGDRMQLLAVRDA